MYAYPISTVSDFSRIRDRSVSIFHQKLLVIDYSLLGFELFVSAHKKQSAGIVTIIGTTS